MPGKKPHSPASHRKKAVPYLQALFDVCKTNVSHEEWDLTAHTQEIKACDYEVFNEYINYFKEFNNQDAFEYTHLVRQFEAYLDNEQNCIKTDKARTAYDEALYQDIDHKHRTGIYKVNLGVRILTKVLPQAKLNTKQRERIRQELLHEIFYHLLGCTELAVKCYTRLDGLTPQTSIMLLSHLETYLEEYLATISNPILLTKTIRLFASLEQGYEFYLLRGAPEKAQAIKNLFLIVHGKIGPVLNSMKPCELKTKITQELTQTINEHNRAKARITSNPWVSLFTFYDRDWVGNTQARRAIDIEQGSEALLSLLKDPDAQAQAEFVARLQDLLKYYNSLTENDITPEIIASYALLMREIYQTSLKSDLPQDHTVAFALRHILYSIGDDIEADSPITQKLISCYEIFKSAPLAVDPHANSKDFRNKCIQLKSEYVAYDNSNPKHWNTTRHLELATALEQLFINFKSVPAQMVESSAKALYEVILTRLKKYHDLQYKQLATELQTLLFSLAKLKKAQNEATHLIASSELAALVEMATTLEPMLAPVDEPKQAPSTEQVLISPYEDIPEQNLVKTPVLSSEQSPVISPASPPDMTQEVVEEVFTQPSGFMVASKDEVDAQVQLLAEKLQQVRISQNKEQSQATQLEMDDLKNNLETRLKAVELAHERKVSKQKEKNEKEQQETKRAIEKQHEKKVDKFKKQSARALHKLTEDHLTKKAELVAKMEKAHQDKMTQHAKEQQAQLKQLKAKNKAEVKALRKEIQAGTALTDLRAEFQAQSEHLQREFEAKKQALLKQAQDDIAKQYDAQLQAQHAQTHAELETIRATLQAQGQRALRHGEIKTQQNFQAAMAPIPLSLLNLLKHLKINSTHRVPLNQYYSHLDKLFVSPNLVDNFNVTFNLGLLKCLFPTLPERYGYIIEKAHPELLAFWRQELHHLNATPKHASNHIALFMLLPILETREANNPTEQIQDCINDFASYFDADPADQNALTKSLASILYDQEVILNPGIPPMRVAGLYAKYCLFEKQYREDIQRLYEIKTLPRGYHLQYGQEKAPMILQTIDPAAALERFTYTNPIKFK